MDAHLRVQSRAHILDPDDPQALRAHQSARLRAGAPACSRCGQAPRELRQRCRDCAWQIRTWDGPLTGASFLLVDPHKREVFFTSLTGTRFYRTLMTALDLIAVPFSPTRVVVSAQGLLERNESWLDDLRSAWTLDDDQALDSAAECLADLLAENVPFTAAAAEYMGELLPRDLLRFDGPPAAAVYYCAEAADTTILDHAGMVAYLVRQARALADDELFDAATRVALLDWCGGQA